MHLYRKALLADSLLPWSKYSFYPKMVVVLIFLAEKVSVLKLVRAYIHGTFELLCSQLVIVDNFVIYLFYILSMIKLFLSGVM